MPYPSLLVLVRHGKSVGNTLDTDGRAKSEYATHDFPLTERGREQAKITGEYLRKEFGNFSFNYVSYYCRAKETAALLYPDTQFIEDSRLAEGQRGIYHTLTGAELAKRFPEEIKRKDKEGLYHYRPPGGENWADVEQRWRSFAQTLWQECFYDDSVLVVSHGQLQICAQRVLESWSIEKVMQRFARKPEYPANASVTVYRGKLVNGRYKLVLDEENIIPWKRKIKNSDR